MVFTSLFWKKKFDCSFPGQDTLGKDISVGEVVFYDVKIEMARIVNIYKTYICLL